MVAGWKGAVEKKDVRIVSRFVVSIRNNAAANQVLIFNSLRYNGIDATKKLAELH